MLSHPEQQGLALVHEVVVADGARLCLERGVAQQAHDAQPVLLHHHDGVGPVGQAVADEVHLAAPSEGAAVPEHHLFKKECEGRGTRHDTTLHAPRRAWPGGRARTRGARRRWR